MTKAILVGFMPVHPELVAKLWHEINPAGIRSCPHVANRVGVQRVDRAITKTLVIRWIEAEGCKAISSGMIHAEATVLRSNPQIT